MSILEKLGLGQKSREGSPNIGKKKKKKQKEAEKKKIKYLRILIFSVFIISILITLPQTTFQPVASHSINEPWRADDLTAPFTFSIKKSSAELEEERREIREATPPVYHSDQNAAMAVEARIDSVYRKLQPVLDTYLQWQRAKENNDSSAQNDSIRFLQERNFLDLEISDSAWEIILADYEDIQNTTTNRQLVIDAVRSNVSSVTADIFDRGLVDRPKDDIVQDEIIIRNLIDRTERTVNISRVFDMNEAKEFASVQFNRALNSRSAEIAFELFSGVIQPNLLYNEEDTEAILNERLENISTTKGTVDQGEIIIRKGDIVTEERAIKLESLAEARAASASDYERFMRAFGESIIIIAAALVFLFYLYLYRLNIFNQPPMFLLVFIVMGVMILATAATYQLDGVNGYIVPIAVAPIILTIIFDSRVGLMATISIAMITGVINDNSFEFVIATIVACSLGVFSVRDIKNRSQFFFTTPGVVMLSYIVILAGFGLSRFAGWDTFTSNLVFVIINSVFILFTYPLILLIEKLFKITTDFTLLELGDTNLPLMKKLMNEAPGTFHHSLQVANLAESAASDIGANALLCRVGAMYHDIGKIDKPAYFIENQSKSNDHDKLKPKMSALVIKNHVSEGVKLAKEYGLPSLIIEFIKTHHGTSLIKYFYGKAQNEKESIPEEDFRYDGPTPYTREQGILMLADGVEAASRSMKDPNYSKLENLINRLVDDHINDGQLSNCPLTFKQIQIIKKSFLNILVGVYHSRVEYPEDKDKKDSGMRSGHRQTEKESNEPAEQKSDESSASAETKSEE
ncbi:HD family phosphohydrolase [Rhodohalobacter halophilus]|uniref:HD family phosphohydrolase n=1 Tax=Rhodohalobacter halophilus TaxID=1812810 RepID=UPI00083F6CF3|nr:HDIG domain-containing metalloprotein [Rhodohalobacter halophilus]